MKVWILATDDPGARLLRATAYATEAEALEALRVNYADGEDVPDDALIDYVVDQGIEVYLDEQSIDIDR